jgi:hypothetical protein
MKVSLNSKYLGCGLYLPALHREYRAQMHRHSTYAVTQ